jgi:hypothetical protein
MRMEKFTFSVLGIYPLLLWTYYNGRKFQVMFITRLEYMENMSLALSSFSIAKDADE